MCEAGIAVTGWAASQSTVPMLTQHALAAPKVDAVATTHVILRVTDKGSPPLTRYKRVVVTITP